MQCIVSFCGGGIFKVFDSWFLDEGEESRSVEMRGKCSFSFVLFLKSLSMS